MRNTVFGILCDELGHAADELLEQGPSRPELGLRAWATPAAEVRTVQAPRIPIDFNHDGRPIGELIYLERSAGNLWAVAHVDQRIRPAVSVEVGGIATAVSTPFYFSASRIGTPDFRDVLIDSVALTELSARVAAQPVTFLSGMLDHRGAADRHAWALKDGFTRDLLTRAAHAHLDRRRGDPICVNDPQPEHRARQSAAAPILDPDEDARPAGTMRYRSATQLGVSFPDRTIELIVMPAEQEALVEHNGRMITEICSRGAFAGTEKRADRIRVNRDHQLERTVGRAIALDPHSELGLIGALRIARTELGDETLALAGEECLDASAGYLPMPNGEQWETRNRCRITQAFLGHIALTPDPAYQGAHVLSVRHAAAELHATPR
jgi:phage head maturation protease